MHAIRITNEKNLSLYQNSSDSIFLALEILVQEKYLLVHPL